MLDAAKNALHNIFFCTVYLTGTILLIACLSAGAITLLSNASKNGSSGSSSDSSN